jgi:hypothetical protein
MMHDGISNPIFEASRETTAMGFLVPASLALIIYVLLLVLVLRDVSPGSGKKIIVFLLKIFGKK